VHICKVPSANLQSMREYTHTDSVAGIAAVPQLFVSRTDGLEKPDTRR